MTSRLVTLVLLIGALGGCTAMSSPPELAMPSSKAPRQPINKEPDDLAIGRSDTRRLDISHATQGRVRRVGLGDSVVGAGQAGESNAERFPLTTRYVFGVSQPVVHCAVQHVCDIELQAGEKITQAPRIGDKARWGVDIVMAGQAPNETPHITLMPLEAGIETSLVVLTNRRTYHLFLRATKQHAMLHVSFTYPEYMTARWNALAPVVPAVTSAIVTPASPVAPVPNGK